MFTPEEIKLIREDVYFNKDEIICGIEHYLNYEGVTEKEFDNLISLLEIIEDKDIPEVLPSFDEDAIMGYCINIQEGVIAYSKVEDFFFEYDNAAHQLVLSSFSWEEDDDGWMVSLN